MKPEASKTDSDRLIRTFLAIPLDRATLNRIESIQQRMQPTLPEIRWTDRNNLHLTLHFFGDITEENLEKVDKIVVSVGSLFAPFDLTLTGIGAFPSTDRARVVWIGVKSAKLRELHRALQTKLRDAETPIECRPFRPHITIGRSRQQPGRILSQQQAIVTDTMRVSRMILYESRLQPTGAEHHPRHTILLTKP